MGESFASGKDAGAPSSLTARKAVGGGRASKSKREVRPRPVCGVGWCAVWRGAGGLAKK